MLKKITVTSKIITMGSFTGKGCATMGKMGIPGASKISHGWLYKIFFSFLKPWLQN
jgi:hypothetical protein